MRLPRRSASLASPNVRGPAADGCASTGAAPGVLVAHEHRIGREGLRLLLEHAALPVRAEAADVDEVVRAARECRPEVAVIDLGPRSLDAIHGLVATSPATMPVLLTSVAEPQRASSALHDGARGYVLKSQGIAGLAHAVREVASGRVYLSELIAAQVVESSLCRGNGGSALTPRQRQVLQLVAEGRTTKEVAELLGVSVKTADSHRTRLMEKLAVHEIAGLVRYAIRLGLVEP